MTMPVYAIPGTRTESVEATRAHRRPISVLAIRYAGIAVLDITIALVTLTAAYAVERLSKRPYAGARSHG